MKTAVYAGTRNLYADMLPAVKSLLIHSDVEKIYLLIEDDAFPYALPDCVKTINVKNQQYFRPGGPNWNKKWTWMVLMRCALTKLLPPEDRVLSLDVDTIVELDISKLWDMPLDDVYFAAAREPVKSRPDVLYCNAGVVLYNLKKLRDGMDDRIINELNAAPYECTDQDVINLLCQGKIGLIPADYNVCDYTDPFRLRKIIHFAAVRHWNHMPEVQKYREIPWSEIRGGLCVT